MQARIKLQAGKIKKQVVETTCESHEKNSIPQLVLYIQG
jgi:hypothetical protein